MPNANLIEALVELRSKYTSRVIKDKRSEALAHLSDDQTFAEFLRNCPDDAALWELGFRYQSMIDFVDYVPVDIQ